MPYITNKTRTSIMSSNHGLTSLTQKSSFRHAKRYGSSSGFSDKTLGFAISYRWHAKLITLSKRTPTSIFAFKRSDYGSRYMVRNANS